MRKYKVLFLTNQTSPYMISFFKELGKLVNLTVLFEQKKSDVESWNNFSFNNFTGVLLKSFKISKYGAFAPAVVTFLRKKHDFIIVSNPTSPTGILAIAFMKIFSINYIIESEGGYPGNGLNYKELIKKVIFKNARYYLSGNNSGDDYFIKYGAQKEKIYRYKFSSIYFKDILNRVITKSEKLQLREKYNLTGKLLTIAVGRYSVEKNYRWLIKEWKKMPSDFTLYIIGQGPEKALLQTEININNLNNVFLIDYMKHNELLDFMTSFDLFIHPTRSDVWGLVINEAMAKGLPVITTKYCLSASELISNAENGFILELDDSFIQMVYALLSDENLTIKMANNNLKKIKSYTFETMASDHINYFNEFYSFSHNKET